MRKNTFARLLSMTLAVLMACSVLSIGAFAEEPVLTVAAAADEETTASSGTSIDALLDDELNAINYKTYLERNADAKKGKTAFTVDCTDYIEGELTDADVEVVDAGEYNNGEGKALLIGETGTVSWKVDVPSSGMYCMELTYYPISNKATSIERRFTINGELPFKEARYLTFSKVWKDQYPEDGGFETDSTGSDVRPEKIEVPEWRTIDVYDPDGIYSVPLQFYFEEGEGYISFESLREPIIMKSIKFYPYEELKTYEEMEKEYEAKGYKPVSSEATLKIQAERPEATSDQMVYPVYDRTSAITEPQHPSEIRLNTIGGDKWKTPGQWVRYYITPTETGLYTIVLRYKQSLLAGMFTSRRLYINGKIPFAEAGALRFNYADGWQVGALGDGETEYQFYFEAGKEYEIIMEVCLGDLGATTNKVSDSVKSLNQDYLSILQLTGATPDEYRDYGFYRALPNTVRDLGAQKKVLEEVLVEINTTTGMKGSQVTTIEDTIRILEKMSGRDSEEEIAKNLSNLKTYIGNLGTWLKDIQSQPLEIDYFIFQSADESKPKASENFWQSVWFEMRSFVASFFSDYNAMGSGDEGDSSKSIEVWTSSDRDRARIIRNLIDNEFTPQTGISVDLKLVAGGTLLPSILSGVGPEINLGNTSGDIINYAIRGAIVPVKTNDETNEYYNLFSDVDEYIADNFVESATIPLSFKGYDIDGKYRDEIYALPDSQSFSMLFYRKDIFNSLGLEVPKTWDDMLALIPVLQYNNMEVGINMGGPQGTFNAMLYQRGGTFWADDGMRVNLDSNLSLETFADVCNMFTQYSLPYQYDFANRFRTGEMPIGIGDYCGLYNQLTVFATELRGLWGFAEVPGTVQEDGTIDNTIISTVSGIIFPSGLDVELAPYAWEFMKWYCDASFQHQYANELTAIVGPATKISPANVEALDEMSWTTDELAAIKRQFSKLAAIEEYPGGYICSRYFEFAFAAAYNDGSDPVECIQEYIPLINKEISRKRKEFNLDTLEIGQTLADKLAEKEAAGE